MLDVTVKTLDGQNRSFSVPESTTVKQFKEKIAGSINIAADRQRLIYQGRVLQDDKKLNDYDVHGKVIHVVQRAPPSSRGANNSNDTPTATMGMPGGGFPARDFALGAFAVPDPMDPNQVQNIVQQVLSGMGDVGQHARVTSRTSPDGSAVDVHINLNQAGPAMVQSESQLRVDLVYRMVRLIREALDRLENMRSEESSPGGSGTSTPSDSSRTGARGESDARPAGGAAAATTETGTSTSSDTNATGQRVQPNPHTPALSTALTELLELQERFQPWLAQYNELLQNDPDFEGKDDDLRNNQRVINQVSVILHHLSHAFHSISDIMIDLSSSRPRQLRAVPAPPPPPTAVIHQTIPVQAQISVNTALAGSPRLLRRQPPTTASSTTNSQTANSQTTTTSTSTQAVPTETTPVTSSQTSVTSGTTTTPARATATTAQGPLTHQGSTNPYVFMELGPNSLSVNSISAHVFSSDRNGSSATNTATTASSMSSRTTTTSSTSFAGGSFGVPPGAIPIRFGSIPMASSTGRVPAGAIPVTVATPSGAPPEFMQGLVQMALQAAAQRVSGGNTGTTATSSATSSTPTSATSTTSASGTASSTQATSTAPTSSSSTGATTGSPTATGIRLPALMALDSRSVDPYLPCSSRHFSMIRSTRRANGGEQSVNDVVGNLVSALIGQTNQGTQGQSSGNGAAATAGSGAATSATSTSSSNTTTTGTSAQNVFNPFAALFTPMPAPGRRTDGSQSSGATNSTAMNDFASRLHHILQEGRSNTPPTTTSSGGTPRTGGTGASSGAMSDDMFAQLVSGIGSQLSQVMRGDGGVSITDFIRSMEQNYNVSQGEGLLNDLFQMIGEHMNFADLLQVFFGRPEPLQALRQPLRTFIQQRIMDNQEPTDENIEASVERAIESLQESIDLVCAEPGIQVEEDIDFKATLTEFIRQQMRKIIAMILRSSDNDPLFGQCLFNHCRTSIHESIVLCRLCLRNGIEGCDQILRSRVQYISSDISNPMIQNWMLTMSSQQLHQILPFIRISEDEVQRYVVRTSQRMEASPLLSETSEAASMMSTESAAEDVRAVESIATAAVAEAPPCGDEMEEEGNEASAESMEVEAAEEAVTVASSSEPSTRHMNGDMEASAVINRENLPDVVIGSQSWHRELPEDWIPVISRDVQTQRRQAPQAPLSDAYLNGMPAKRRKVIRKEGLVSSTEGNASKVIPQSVKQAVAAAGVEPITNFDEIEQDAAANSTLHSVYEQQVLSDMRERLQTDSDYTPERFPESEEYFRKGTKK